MKRPLNAKEAVAMFEAIDHVKTEGELRAERASRLPFPLKWKYSEDGYPQDVCCASRCNELTAIIDDSNVHWHGRVPLCERHWLIRCGETSTRRRGGKKKSS